MPTAVRSHVIVIALALMLLATSTIVTCNLKFGDPAKFVLFVNRLDHTITIEYRIRTDGRPSQWLPAVTIPPKSQKEVPLVIRGKGIEIRATTPFGDVVFDRFYQWEAFPKGKTFTIVVE